MKVRKTFSLKQHTPLIHFQHAQDGACLRATELKPKIDNWIISQLCGLDYREKTEEIPQALLERHPEWIVGGGKGQHPALDYKLRIFGELKDSFLVASNISRPGQAKLDREGIKYLTKTPYFADNEPIKNGELDRAKRGLMFENIELEIFCLDTNLMKAVEEALPYVFTYNNFGIRQSKGFGCFSLEDTNKEKYESYLTKDLYYKKSMVYHFDQSRRSPNISALLQKIEGEYKILKSGFAKTPSQMDEYFTGKNLEWEKPIIKKELVKNKRFPSKEDYSSDQKRKYIRALLGVAELYEFPRDREKISIICTDVDPDPESSTLLVERFRSPITFKVFDNSVYLLPGLIPDEIYGRTFTFTNKGGFSITLKTPEKGVFDLDEFLENHVDNNWSYVNK